MNALIRSNLSIYRSLANVRLFCSSGIPKNALGDLISAQNQQENGVIFDKKPFKVNLVPEKNFSWCLCGKSKQ
jgi:CDGSH iron-sulfur domain-containing protein 3